MGPLSWNGGVFFACAGHSTTADAATHIAVRAVAPALGRGHRPSDPLTNDALGSVRVRLLLLIVLISNRLATHADARGIERRARRAKPASGAAGARHLQGDARSLSAYRRAHPEAPTESRQPGHRVKTPWIK
jgi:hypothetical protein